MVSHHLNGIPQRTAELALGCRQTATNRDIKHSDNRLCCHYPCAPSFKASAHPPSISGRLTISPKVLPASSSRTANDAMTTTTTTTETRVSHCATYCTTFPTGSPTPGRLTSLSWRSTVPAISSDCMLLGRRLGQRTVLNQATKLSLTGRILDAEHRRRVCKMHLNSVEYEVAP